MARSLTGAFITELTAESNYPAIFYEGEFDGQTLRLWSGGWNIDWNSELWLGNGWLHGIQPPAETGEVVARGASVILSGLPATVISLILASSQHQHKGSIWLAFMGNEGTTVIADPFLLFSGYLDVPQLNYNATASSVTIKYESKIIDLRKPRMFRYSDASQQVSYPGDRGFEYMTFIQQWQGFWGKNNAPIET